MALRFAAICFALCMALAAAFGESPTTVPTTEPTTEPTTAPTIRPGRRLGIGVEDLTERADGEDQIWLLGGNLRVIRVVKDSRAERLGVQVGDLVKRINGREMKTTGDIFSEIRASETVTLDLMRKGKPLTIAEPTTRP